MSLDELRDAYSNLSETVRAPDGVRYRGLLRDGTPVDVVALAPELSALVKDEPRFFETLERASVIRHAALASPLVWGRGREGTLHVAFGVAGDPLESSASTMSVAAAGVELLDALAVVHGTGLAHGAITARRVVRGPRGPLLAEFGILPALVAAGVSAGAATRLCSEPPYLSPEAQGGSVPDEQSDIFAMGAVLYEVLTGKPPFGGRTTRYVLASVLSDDAGEGAAVSGNPVVDALLRAIERQPEDRWPNARAFGQALAAGMPPVADAAGAASSTAGKNGCMPVAAAAIGVTALLRLLA